MQELITVLKADDPCCTICTSPLTDTRALITICSHVFCRKCIRKALIDKPICPLCRNHLSEADMFSAAPPGSSSNIDSSSARSTKVEALRNLLVENTVAKSVVFSQYTMMLSSLEEILRDAGFKTLHLYRRKDDSNKARVIEQFQTLEEDRPMVLLVSIRAAKENLDLRAASRVYLMEACKKKAEKRAVRCVYQFGQRKNVKIVRLIAKDSIEEKILELHEKKISSSPSGSTVRWCADRIGLNETQFILEE